MKIIFNFIIMFVLFLESTYSQTPYGWKPINETIPRIKLNLPDKNLTKKDTLGMIMYNSITTDNLITSQASILNNYSTSGNQELKHYLTQSGETDTLNAIAKYIIATSVPTTCFYKLRAKITNQEVLVLGLKNEINIESNNSITYFISYIRIATNNKRILLNTLSAQEIYLNPLITAKEICFNSIEFY